jgi:hypothetical protein
MHFQREPHAETKLVRCTHGVAFDVALDLRPDSATFRQWVGVEISSDNHRMLYIPTGCAHGYQTLTDDTELHYMTSQLYVAQSATGVRHDDPAFAIHWPLPVTCISDADTGWPYFSPASPRLATKGISMILVDTALAKRQAEDRPLRVALVGAGYMGRGIALHFLAPSWECAGRGVESDHCRRAPRTPRAESRDRAPFQCSRSRGRDCSEQARDY